MVLESRDWSPTPFPVFVPQPLKCLEYRHVSPYWDNLIQLFYFMYSYPNSERADISFSFEGNIVSFESVCQSLCSSEFRLSGCVNSAWVDETQSAVCSKC